MRSGFNRRSFLQSGAGAGMLAGLGDLAFLSELRPVSAAETKLDPQGVRLRPEIEPIVRLIIDTPRNRLLEEVAARIKDGLSYQELLAGLLLAGVINVEPRPSVGHKFHAVLVVNSAHLASLASPPEHRWLPIFWALDYYKSSEAADVKERGDWRMPAAKESSIPAAHQAKGEFLQAMERWDEAGADAAIAGLARTAGMNEIYELLFRFGARDFRSIGHKAIYVANSLRTLQCIGWQHAEPVLRSLAYALLMNDGKNPSKSNEEADRPWRRNQELAAKVRPDWRDGKPSREGTEQLLSVLRTGSNDDACDAVVEALNGGVAPQSVWDALHVVAGEMLMRQPGIVAIHGVTTTNAMRYAYEASSDDETRRLLMLQNAAFLPMFRGAMQQRGKIAELTVDQLQPRPATGGESLDGLFADVGRNNRSAAEQVLGHLQETGDARQFIDAARVMVFLKGDDAHDYKFSSAVLEDYYQVSPDYRGVYLASNVFNLHGSSEKDNPLVQRTRAALA